MAMWVWLFYLIILVGVVFLLVYLARRRWAASPAASAPAQQMPLYTLATMPDGSQQMVPVPQELVNHVSAGSKSANGVGIAALLVGIVSVACLVIGQVVSRNGASSCLLDGNCSSLQTATALTWVSLVAGVIGLILGIVAITMCRQHRANNLPVAIVGLCLSSIILVIFLVALVFLGSLLGGV